MRAIASWGFLAMQDGVVPANDEMVCSLLDVRSLFGFPGDSVRGGLLGDILGILLISSQFL